MAELSGREASCLLIQSHRVTAIFDIHVDEYMRKDS